MDGRRTLSHPPVCGSARLSMNAHAIQSLEQPRLVLCVCGAGEGSCLLAAESATSVNPAPPSRLPCSPAPPCLPPLSTPASSNHLSPLPKIGTSWASTTTV
eukprot:28437-Chlamydomonas_euryale.AAC.2